MRELYQLLIEPIADLLPANPSDRVIFIPYDSLLLVPFPTLQDASGQYLIENHTISTAPSLQVLGLTQQLQRESAIEPSQVLVVGNPIMPSLPAIVPQPPLSSLPGAEQEAIAIAQQFQTQPMLGEAADSTQVLMTEFYRQLEQQPDKAQALRQAMLQTMQEYPEPID